jgi:methionyl-tRNA formyltransferase
MNPLTHVALPGAKGAAAALSAWTPPTISPTDDLLILNHFVAPDTVQLAWQHGIPAFQLNRLGSPAVHKWLADLALDVVCVACFPWRIPASLLALPAYGFLNVHPSLLPAYRGPAPLFWQLRDGLCKIGVTLHWMDADFDRGNIAAQSTVSLADGVSGPEADRRCAAVGAQLLRDLLPQLAHTPSTALPLGQPQPAGGSHQPWPTAADFRLSLDWSARHAYNFMCGTAEWLQPYPVTLAGEDLRLRKAIAYDATQRLTTPFVRQGDEVQIEFQPGVLRARIC